MSPILVLDWILVGFAATALTGFVGLLAGIGAICIQAYRDE